MNERIKELMGKTLDDKFSHTWDTMTHEGLLMFSEKFAEMIVGECLNLVDRGGEFVSRPKLVERIKEHFGVEE